VLSNVELTHRRVVTNIAIVRDPGHDEPWLIAMSEKLSYLSTLDYAARWGIEPMFSDFKSRGFGLEQSQLRSPDRLARLLLVISLALHVAVSTGLWDATNNPSTDEKKAPSRQPRNLHRGRLSWFTRGLAHCSDDPVLSPNATALGNDSNRWVVRAHKKKKNRFQRVLSLHDSRM
jgi:hypothetical protein